jgi:hypothetical protein
MEFLTSGSVRGGVLYLRNRKRMEAALSHWRDCAVTVTITKAYATRSKPQNDYYHAVCVELVASHTGYTHLEAHELLKALHLPRESRREGTERAPPGRLRDRRQHDEVEQAGIH